VLTLVCGGAAHGQQGDFELTVDNIMRGPEHVGEAPSGVRWSDDGAWLYFRWKPGGRPWHESPALYRVRVRGGTPERLSDEAADSLGALLASGDVSDDERARVVAWRGDLFIIDRRNGSLRQLTDTRDQESSPVFDRTGRTVYYLAERGGISNIHALDLAGGTLRQLTDVRSGPAPRDSVPAAGQRGFLERQQEELFEHVRRARAQREEEEARREAREARAVQPLYLERDERIRTLAVEPGGSYAVIVAAKPSDDARRTLIPDWVTRSGYTETREVRSKVGDLQSETGRFGIVAVADGAVRWLELARATGDTAASFYSANFLGWNEQGTHGLLAAQSADFNDAWLWSLDARTGALTLLRNDHDEAWVAGPCPFWFGCAGFLPDGSTVYFASERDGFNHVYTVPVTGGDARQLTSGAWEVQGIEVAPTEDRFYLTTNEGSPHEVHFYHMRFDGTRTRITTERGRQEATASPDGRRIAVVHSFANVPPELYLADNRPGTAMQRVTTSPTDAWLAGPWIAPEIIHIPARDGVPVPARIYRPTDLGAQPSGAAVIFVHGAGYLQNVHDWWSSYYREYMFHHLLAQRGYVVLDLDYRGSAGYGRDWRTAIYRHMGGQDLSDQVDASRWLGEQYGIESERVGIYGGSYGGFITLMALFTAADDFGAGAALRSVTDWAHYNHPYTGRILNLPQDDSVAYRQSSPIYFAEGLDDPLLIAHGMVDTNVHFSDVVRLAQRLIELRKTDWEMAAYPVENHGFVEPTSWADEYRRILKLFEEELRP
jgi:dipeptidyl aminopeptidase/acylaminoacyl peptidase